MSTVEFDRTSQATLQCETMRFGICCGPYLLGEKRSDIARLLTIVRDAGADYVEFPVAATDADNAETTFAPLRAAMENAPLKVEAFNGFIPPHHRITGAEVDLPKVLQFAQTALARCKQLGGEVVVLGSGGARRVPAGFAMKKAKTQFLQFCRELGPIAESVGITIAIEPLNTREDNLINTVAQGAQIVDEVKHPRIRLLADLYHIGEDAQPLSDSADAGARLVHAHLAGKGRAAPGPQDGGQDYLGFFRALRAARYDALGHGARCSFEGRLDDIAAQGKPLVDAMRRYWNESG